MAWGGGRALSHPPLLAHSLLTQHLLSTQDWAAASQDSCLHPRSCPHPRRSIHTMPPKHPSSSYQTTRTPTRPTFRHQGGKSTPSCPGLPAAHRYTHNLEGPALPRPQLGLPSLASSPRPPAALHPSSHPGSSSPASRSSH